MTWRKLCLLPDGAVAMQYQAVPLCAQPVASGHALTYRSRSPVQAEQAS